MGKAIIGGVRQEVAQAKGRRREREVCKDGRRRRKGGWAKEGKSIAALRGNVKLEEGGRDEGQVIRERLGSAVGDTDAVCTLSPISLSRMGAICRQGRSAN